MPPKTNTKRLVNKVSSINLVDRDNHPDFKLFFSLDLWAEGNALNGPSDPTLYHDLLQDFKGHAAYLQGPNGKRCFLLYTLSPKKMWNLEHIFTVPLEWLVETIYSPQIPKSTQEELTNPSLRPVIYQYIQLGRW